MFVTSLIVCGSGTWSSTTRAPSCAMTSAALRTAASISAWTPWKKKFSATPTRRPATLRPSAAR